MKKKLLSSLLSILLVFSLVIGGASYFAPISDSVAYADPPVDAYQPSVDDPLTPDEQSLIESVDADYIFGHVKEVSDNIGIRVAGGPADERASAYFADAFQDLGYEPYLPATGIDGVVDYFQTISGAALSTSVTNQIGGSITVNGHEYPANAPTYSAASKYFGYERPEVKGNTVYFETVAQAAAATSGEIRNKVVLTNRPSGTYSVASLADDARAIESKGALALVYFYSKWTVNARGKTSGESIFGAPTSAGADINIPVILTSYFDGQSILKSLTYHDENDHQDKIGSANVTVVNRRNTAIRNIVAVKKAATPTDKYVLVGGHNDSRFGAVGANDNLSGPTTILGIAKALKDVPLTYNVVFAFWGGEEAGMSGSRYFYNNNIVAGDGYKDTIAYFNLDMAATSQKTNAHLTIHTPTNGPDGTPWKSWAGQVVSTQAERLWDYADGSWGDWWAKDWVDANGDKQVVGIETSGGCSDHASISGYNASPSVPVQNALVPVVYTFWRAGPAGAGRGDDTELNYHVVGDRYDWPVDPADNFKLEGEDEYYAGNYSKERAEILADVYALSIYDAADGIPVKRTSVEQVTVLKSLISGFEKFDEAYFTAASWSPFVAAIDKAKAILAAPNNYEYEEAAAAITAVVKAQNELVLETKAEKKSLNAAIEAAKVVIANSDSYIPLSISNLTEKLNAAILVAADADATQEKVDAAYTTLSTALSELFEKGDKELLSLYVSVLSDFVPTNYTAESWTAFSNALTKAKAVLAEPNARRDEVEAAYTALITTLGELTVKANFASLNSAINVADTILANAADYVASSLTGLAEALNAAKAVAGNSNASQSNVNAAASTLNDRILAARLLPDKSGLLNAYYTAKNVNAALYTPAGIASLTVAVNAAEGVLNKVDATQAEIDSVTELLGSAITSLVAIPSTKVSDENRDKAKAKVLSKDNTLKKILKSTGKFSPAFKSGKTSYTLTISKNKASVRITPKKNGSKEKIRIKIGNGTYKAKSSINISLKKGTSKTVYIKVTSESGASKIYKVKVVRGK